MVLLNVSNLRWVPKQKKRNQAIFLELLRGGWFESGIFVNPPLVPGAARWRGRLPRAEVREVPDRPAGVSIVDVHFPLPLTWRQPVVDWSSRRIAGQLMSDILGGKPYVLWMNSVQPLSGLLAQILAAGATRCIFDASDDFTSFEGVSADTLDAVLGYVDTVVCVNDAVAAGIQHPSRITFENCTDFDSFQRVPPGFSLPPWVPKPAGTQIIGFIGGLNQGRVDFELLDTLLRRFAHARFLFAGYTNNPKVEQFLAGFANVTHLGLIAYDQLPAVIRTFDVAIVPHLDNEHTRGNDLLKVLDYFACGVPVVTTDVSNVRKYAGACHIAATHDEFVGFVEGILSGRTSHDPAPGQRFAMARTWAARVPELARQIFPELTAAAAAAADDADADDGAAEDGAAEDAHADASSLRAAARPDPRRIP